MAKGQSKKDIMSERLKRDLARELGVADIVEREGWGAVPSKDCGRLVKLAVERAERIIQGQRA
ncbi:MAG: small, acid-soluble spore protein, alpha/beta type [Bacillota bacterium]